jgi:hypothetical protein
MIVPLLVRTTRAASELNSKKTKNQDYSTSSSSTGTLSFFLALFLFLSGAVQLVQGQAAMFKDTLITFDQTGFVNTGDALEIELKFMPWNRNLTDGDMVRWWRWWGTAV